MQMLRDYQVKGINDIRQAFAQGFKNICFVAPCGAGKTKMMSWMDSESAKRGMKSLFVVHRRELLDQALKSGCSAVTSVQTLVRKPLDWSPDLLIFDEAHHATAGSWRKVMAMYPEAWVVGLTATPARLGGQGLGDVFETLVIGPDPEDLIKRGYLAPYKYYAPPVQADLTNLDIRAGDYQLEQIAYQMDRPQVIGDAVEHYQRLANGKQAVAYCASIAHSQHTAEAFQLVGINALHVDGKTPDKERDRIMNDFKDGKIKILCNVDLISEGFDVPSMEAVILLRPTASLTLFIQQAMRPMRPGINKTAIILDHVGNVLKHGLPDAYREWELHPKRKKKRGTSQGDISIRQCPQCYGVHKPADRCLWCGFVYQVKPREIEQVKGELKEFNPEEKKARRMAIGQAKTLEDLRGIAAQRGYKPGWVWYQAQSKGIRE